MSVNSLTLLSISAIAKWAGFGFSGAMIFLLQSYHSHTSLGCSLNASGVASSSALKFLQMPSLPLNVGTPLSAEIPAPVNTVTIFELCNRSFTSWAVYFFCIYILNKACSTALNLKGLQAAQKVYWKVIPLSIIVNFLSSQNRNVRFLYNNRLKVRDVSDNILI